MLSWLLHRTFMGPAEEQLGCFHMYYGPEFIAQAVKDWLAKRSIGTHYIDPGSPWQNAYGESFNSIFRTTCLDRWAFESINEARAVIEQWQGRIQHDPSARITQRTVAGPVY